MPICGRGGEDGAEVARGRVNPFDPHTISACSTKGDTFVDDHTGVGDRNRVFKKTGLSKLHLWKISGHQYLSPIDHWDAEIVVVR